MYLKDIRACVDRVLDIDRYLRAQKRAADLFYGPFPKPKRSETPDVPVAALALLPGKLWKPGMTLRVRFLDGDPVVQQRMQPFAHEWSKYANIQFDFGNDPNAEIRISFRQRGAWSHLGTDALGIARNQPTMNYGWLTPTMADDEYARVVVHEFGHVLACIHEHQNPVADIPWDKPVVYRYYSGAPNYWTKQEVDANLFQTYDKTKTNFSTFDPKSIMLYPIPNAFTLGDFEVGLNHSLSEMDKQFIATSYPYPPKLRGEMVIDGEAVSESIGLPAEVDKFTFTVVTAGRYRMETLGKQDLIMEVYGPNDGKLKIGADDDSGVGLNPCLIQRLQPGVYTILVRHFSEKKTGSYQVQVKSER